MNGILNFSIDFNVVHRKVDWRNPKMKSLNSMPNLKFELKYPHACSNRMPLFAGGLWAPSTLKQDIMLTLMGPACLLTPTYYSPLFFTATSVSKQAWNKAIGAQNVTLS